MVVTGTTLHSAFELLGAVEARQVRLHFQAITDLDSDVVSGFEALVRWQHPSRGLLGPGEFLPTDMNGGLGWALTNFVLDEAIRRCAEWQRGGLAAGVSVNVAPGRLADEVLPGQVAEILERHRVAPHWLTVEVTETRCSVDPAGIRDALIALARMGVRISLDDFGTGDSTLARLQDLHFDEIKIDRRFVAEAASSPTDRNIVAFTTGLAHSLGMKVVAEGVETEKCLQALRDLGVDFAQGFHLHRPQPRGPFGIPRGTPRS